MVEVKMIRKLTDKGLRALEGKQVVIVVGVEYPMGASSSPNTVLITRVNADGSFTYRNYPYQDRECYVGPGSAGIYRDLILTGCRTERDRMANVCERGVMDTGMVPDWCRKKLAFVEAVIRGETPVATESAEAKIEAYKSVEFDLRVKPGTPDEAFANDRGNTDPWYAAEDYGGLASSGDGAGTVYHVHGKLGAARRAKADPRFEFLGCKSRNTADRGAPVEV